MAITCFVFLLNSFTTSPEVELMETSYLQGGRKAKKPFTTSPEVELMETLVSKKLLWRSGRARLYNFS